MLNKSIKDENEINSNRDLVLLKYVEIIMNESYEKNILLIKLKVKDYSL